MKTMVVSRSGGGRWPGAGGYILLGLAYLFTALSLLQLGLVSGSLSLTTFLPFLVLVLCGSTATYFFDRYKSGRPDPILLPLTFFLSGLGLVLTARLAPPAFVIRQQFWLVIATVLLLLVTLVPNNLNWLRRYKYTWLIGGLFLLAATLVFGVNPSGYGARLWLQVGKIYFQPSEPLKLLLIVFLAAYLADRRRRLVEVKAYIGRVAVPHPSYFGPMLLMWGFSIVLLVWQRDLGAALLFFGTFLGMLYLATGEEARYIWAGMALLLIAGVMGYYLFDVVRLRVDAFLNPWLDPSGRSFQIVQSLLAFASGGFFGQGLGQGLPTAIPVVHTDFVFAAMGEEYGLLGAVVVLACFALLVSRAFRIAMRARSGFEQLLASGIGTMFGLQILVITAGTLKLLPLTGVTLPFVSYGGSSLVTSAVMVGLLLFIANSSHEQRPTYAVRATLYALPPMPHYRLARGILTGFLVVAGGLIFWQILLAPFLNARDDNPRPIIAEQKIRRGRLLAADGTPIAETKVDESGLVERYYPYPALSSVTGYYSLRYGTGGTEALFDSILRGVEGRTEQDLWLDRLLHRPLAGDDVILTIDLPAQMAADKALGTREGAVVVLDIETGAILVMSSHPTFDPNQLDAQWVSLREDAAAPLLNRATQGLFPVGDLARLIGLIGLYEAGAAVPVDPLALPLDEMLAPLGNEGYLATVHQLGLTQSLPGLPSQPALLSNFDNQGTARDLAVTPLHLARALAALEREGYLPEPVLSQTMRGEQTLAKQALAISPEAARRARALLLPVNEQIIGLNGQATPEETGQASLSWFAGLAPTTAIELSQTATPEEMILDPSKIESPPTPLIQENPQAARYVVVVVVVTNKPEEAEALKVAKTVLQPILSKK
ncbi:MAG: FtsW/RodA/SpoVE family cell cycle protein [Anaerolineae bacterium]|nr:FtsW/RodA/SpoVE family cell cycle protein [Anaerolineae bacterium]